MSPKHEKPRSSQPSRPPRNAGKNPAPGSQQEPVARPLPIAAPAPMSENAGNTPAAALTIRQQAALPLIACSPTITQAARASGIGESTLHRWLSDPVFRSHLLHLRQESAQLARQELQSLLPLCASVFADAMQSPDLALRLRAARYALSYIIRISEVEQLNEDIRNLEQAMSQP